MRMPYLNCCICGLPSYIKNGARDRKAARLPLLIFGRSSHEHIDPENHASMIFADAYVHG